MTARVIPVIPFDTWAAAICTRCVEPGHCCKRFHLNGGEQREPWVFWDDDEDGPVLAPPLPFVAVERFWQWTVESGPDTGRTYSEWWWTCPKLDSSSGRCTIYADRPDLCRRYEPLEDGLCAMTPKERET